MFVHFLFHPSVFFIISSTALGFGFRVGSPRQGLLALPLCPGSWVRRSVAIWGSGAPLFLHWVGGGGLPGLEPRAPGPRLSSRTGQGAGPWLARLRPHRGLGAPPHPDLLPGPAGRGGGTGSAWSHLRPLGGSAALGTAANPRQATGGLTGALPPSPSVPSPPGPSRLSPHVGVDA